MSVITSGKATDILDHIIHLSSPGRLQEAVNHFSSLGLIVIPGGAHSDGLTSNALILLSSGVYIELIAFNHEPEFYPPGSPARLSRDNHLWANERPGWIDYSHLGFESVGDVINSRGGGKVTYMEAWNGGRERPDGVTLKWKVIFPARKKHVRGTLPFFCQDVTPRALRVPINSSNTAHTSTAKGIAHIRIFASPSKYSALLGQLTAVLGSGPLAKTPTSVTFALATGTHLIVELGLDRDSEHGVYISEVGFLVAHGHGAGLAGERHSNQRDSYGRVVFVEEGKSY